MILLATAGNFGTICEHVGIYLKELLLMANRFFIGILYLLCHGVVCAGETSRKLGTGDKRPALVRMEASRKLIVRQEKEDLGKWYVRQKSKFLRCDVSCCGRPVGAQKEQWEKEAQIFSAVCQAASFPVNIVLIICDSLYQPQTVMVPLIGCWIKTKTREKAQAAVVVPYYGLRWKALKARPFAPEQFSGLLQNTRAESASENLPSIQRLVVSISVCEMRRAIKVRCPHIKDSDHNHWLSSCSIKYPYTEIVSGNCGTMVDVFCAMHTESGGSTIQLQSQALSPFMYAKRVDVLQAISAAEAIIQPLPSREFLS